MREQVIKWRSDQPEESIREPILIRLHGAFRWGLQYKIPNDKGQKVWVMTDDIKEWAEIA